MKKIINNKSSKKSNRIPHIAIAITTCVLIVAIIQWDRGLFKAEFLEGDIALRTIYAPYDFTIKGDINVLATELARKDAMDSVLPVYILDKEMKNNVLKKSESIVDSVRGLKQTPDITNEEILSKIAEFASTYNLSETLIEEILGLKDLESFYGRIKQVIENFMGRGIISDSAKARLIDANIGTVRLVDEIEGVRSIHDFYTLEDLKKEVEQFSSSIVKDRNQRSIVPDFVNSVLNINIIYDKDRTELEKQAAAEKIVSMYNVKKIKKNEMILDKGERIGKEHITKLKGIEQNEPSVMRIGGIFAIAILVGLLMILLALYVEFYEPDIARGNKELVLIATICVLMLLTAKIIVISPWPSNLVPVAVASMLIAILINSRVAIITTFFLSLLVGVISGNRLDIAGVSLVGGIIGVFAMRGVRRRSQVLAAGLSVGFANMSYLIGVGLMSALDFNTYITESFFGFANGIMSAVIVTGILPIFENTFKITTDISLLELADLNHPLLKEMVIKAPGTYHHSLVVGNLAEAACEAIGANALLARVSSYFHDVGKIEKASYFSENQLAGVSAHDKLSPTMSSLIITNHVKNGVELAREYKLNRKIIDIIKQHHGTGLVFYFFKRALEKVEGEDVGEQSFTYPGPKPQTREAACVLLADSVEAGSRALDDPTPSRIKGLVRKIINNKFIEGQLDECELTLKDLEKIAEIFTHILTGMYHTRVEYPDKPAKTEKNNR
ncbi:MAG: HDIG domain-containing protein [Candidatus Omnitrophica bacterium]|nr:HDIG domain-containing protein [Candidatus Omnitrophota bacterium]